MDSSRRSALALCTFSSRALALALLLLLSACGERVLSTDDEACCDASPPTHDGSTAPEHTIPAEGDCQPDWDCETRGTRTFCSSRGRWTLPVLGSRWTCHLATLNDTRSWVCTGLSPLVAPVPYLPCSFDWDCHSVRAAEPEGGEPYEILRCTRPDGVQDRPPDDDTRRYVCVKGSAYGDTGTRCEVIAKAEVPPVGVDHPISPNSRCVPGTRAWCSGLQHGGWGQVACKPSGEWETKVVNGKHVLDCISMSDGRRPDTACACFHPYFNPSCCERADCLVPYDGEGRICDKSDGALCASCNPQKPECKEPGSRCVATNAMETFCASGCDGLGSCPSGYECLTVKTGASSSQQCIPVDHSCYYF